MSLDSRGDRKNVTSLTAPAEEEGAEFEDVRLDGDEPKKAPGRFSLLHRFEKGESRPAAAVAGGQDAGSGGALGGVGRLFHHGRSSGNKVVLQQQQQQGESQTVEELRRIEKSTPSVTVE